MADRSKCLILCVSARNPAPPALAAALVSRVELEPELIPFVRRVDVLARGDGWVRYRVFLPLGLRMTFVKAWSPSAVVWLSVSASLGVAQRGRLLLTPTPSGGCEARLQVWTRFPIPGLAALARPAARYAFRRWLEGLAEQPQRNKGAKGG
ncbi:MAG TPA: hypothetical protein VGM37_05125 [Armatimonadota bacterium]|jgi:hypothetical protein